jgi:hypothetical protein
MLAWGRGVDLGARARTPAPASLAIDSDSTFVLVERSPIDDRPVDHALAFRYDVRATPLFPTPIDLGETRLPAGERIALTRPRAGVVRAHLGVRADVEVTSSGEVRPHE